MVRDLVEDGQLLVVIVIVMVMVIVMVISMIRMMIMMNGSDDCYIGDDDEDKVH